QTAPARHSIHTPSLHAALPIFAFGTLTNNDIKYRVYLDNPGYRNEVFWRQYMPDNLPRTATFKPAWRSATTANRPFWDVRYSHTYALSANGTYWDGLFRTLLGL